MPPEGKSGMLEAGSAALKKVISGSLIRRKTKADGHDSSADCPSLGEDTINTMIENEIIPRLLMAHSTGQVSASGDRKSEIAPAEANRFATMPLEREAAELLEEVDRFLAEGVSVDAIYIDLLAPAARRLGDMWTDDECDFIDVSMGLWRLQEVMREIAGRTPNVMGAIGSPRSILVAPLPGDQHTFGAQMVEEVFARAGWDSQLLSRPRRRELLDALASRAFDLVALTISRDTPSAAVSSLIKGIRSVSVNPHISVMIGGNSVNNNPAIVAEVGADGTGSDARAALEIADRLVSAAPVNAYELR